MPEGKLRIGIVGCGRIAQRMHIPIWQSQSDTVSIVALADPFEANLESAAALCDVEPESRYRDALDLIRRSDIDALDICTPQHMRLKYLLGAAKANKHIFCEKPVTVAPADAEAAADACDRANVTFAVAHPYLWLPEVALARKLLAQGRIGQVRSVIVNYLGVVPEEGAAGNWRRNPGIAGGGVLTDMLHAVYEAEALLGAPFERVSARVTRRDPALQVEDEALCRFEAGSGTALVNVGWGHGPGGVDVTGSEGRISIGYENGATPPWAPVDSFLVAAQDTVEDLTDECRVEGEPGTFPSLRDAFRHNFEDFVQAVRSGDPPLASGRDGLRILQAVLGAYKSSRTGHVVALPLDPREAIFGEGASGLRGTPTAPWLDDQNSALFGAVELEQ